MSGRLNEYRKSLVSNVVSQGPVDNLGHCMTFDWLDMVKLTRARRCEVVTEHVASVTAWTLPVFSFIGGNKNHFTFKKRNWKIFRKTKSDLYSLKNNKIIELNTSRKETFWEQSCVVQPSPPPWLPVYLLVCLSSCLVISLPGLDRFHHEKEFPYNYEGETISSIQGASTARSGLKIRARCVIKAVEPCQHVLKVR